MANEYGGELSDVKYGLELSVEVPTGTSATAPVNMGDLFKIGGTAADGSHYKAVPLAGANDLLTSIVIRAKHSVNRDDQPDLGVKVLGHYSKVLRLPYVTGAAPTLGQSIAASGTNVRRVAGKAFDGTSYVLKVDTVNLIVEVLC